MRKAHLFLSFAFLVAAGGVAAQVPVTPSPVIGASSRMAINDIEVLVTPIALYPDPLVALILPASTNPSDIVLAARFLERGGSAEAAANEAWDAPVKALSRYREVITYLDENLEWTRSLGEVFLTQPDDVMAAVQTVRARAKNAGLLTSNAHQEVIVEETIIEIVPAQPTVIYVPRYDPEILYVSRPSYFHSSFLSFGIGYSIGTWLNYDCDWRHRSVHVVHRPHTWYHQPNWRHRHLHHHHAHAHTWTRWTPPTRHHRHHGHVHRPHRPVHSVMPGRTRHWDRDNHRNHVNPSVAAARSDVVSNFQSGANRPAGIARDHDVRRNTPDRSDRRRFDGNRTHRPASTVNSFAATPPPAAPAAVATPTPTTTPTPRFDRRGRGDDRRQNVSRPNVATPRPNFRQQNPAVATGAPQMPRQRSVEQPRVRQEQPRVRHEQPRQVSPQRATPPPQRAVAHSQPAPSRSNESARPARSENRPSRSDTTERSPSSRHAY